MDSETNLVLQLNQTINDTVIPSSTQKMSWETVMSITWYTELVVNPVIGILGIAGNVISGIVVVKSGLHKPSNVFLLCLAVADTMVLLASFNIPFLLFYHWQPDKYPYGAWEFSYTGAMVCYYVTISIFNIENYGAKLSTYITILITLERLVAIFFPLKFPTIITPKRAWMAVIFISVFWLPWVIFHWFWWKFQYVYDTHHGVHIGYFVVSDIVAGREFDVAKLDDTWIRHLNNSIPLTIVTLGSVFIAVQVKISQRRRAKLVSVSSKKKSTSRTTQTLLMVCFVFSCLRITALFQYVPFFDFYSDTWSNLAWMYQSLYISVLRVNSACNFFIYVVFNKKFRSKLEELPVFHLFFSNRNTPK